MQLPSPGRRRRERRHLHADTLPLQLGRRRVYIIPSRAGAGWAGLLLIMFAGALNYLNNAALLLTCELASAMALTMLGSFRNLHRLTIQSASCQQPVAGRPAIIELRLAQSARRRPALQAQTAATYSERFSLPAGTGSTIIHLPTRFDRRGLQPLPTVKLATRWPLGLFTAWCRLHPEGHVLVWPAAEPDGPPLPQQGAHDHLATHHSSPSDSLPDGLRSYRLGDSPTHVAWKLLARSGEWHTKTHPAAQPRGPVVLSWEQTLGRGHEARIARLARWLQLARQAGLTYSLQLPTVDTGPGRGDRHYSYCMDALAKLP
ncbi:DUF58 domain-containing protein [Frateuria aurantia]